MSSQAPPAGLHGCTGEDSVITGFRQVELLQASTGELATPFGVQNKLLARLAPMCRGIVTG